MKASLANNGTTVEFCFNQDDIWPWPLYDLDVVTHEAARTGLGGTVSPAEVTVEVLGKKPGSGKMSIICSQISPSEVATILGWADSGTELTFTLPKELYQDDEDATYTVKISQYSKGSHVGGGTGYYDLPLSFIVIEE